MELEQEDFQTLTQISTALWADATRAHTQAAETLAAVSLMDLTPSRSMERWARALLDRARTLRESPIDAASLNDPVYRLLPHERLILAALHLGHWSYGRLERVTNLPREELERSAWSARVHVARQRLASEGRGLQVPAAALGASRGSCPAMDPTRPWTQRFLDEETETRDRLFLQNHLMSCPICVRALQQTRDIYFTADRALQTAVSGPLRQAELSEFAEELELAWHRMRKLRESRFPILPGLLRVLAKRDVILVLAVAAAAAAYHALF
ncbi:MAG: hypothetical protein IT285_02625 [Bdellovibrionales bacterium]|nr:hypothetical protein [Bdellovibrionales bacterium]